MKRLPTQIILLLIVFSSTVYASAVNEPLEEPAVKQVILSEKLVRLSWEASSQRDLDRLYQLVDQCVADYGVSAKILQSELGDFPDIGQEEKYQKLNDVGTCLFIKAEAVMNSGQTQEAIHWSTN